MSKGTIIYVGHFELPDKNAAAHRVVTSGKILRELGFRVVYLGTVRDEYFDGIRQSDFSNDVFEESYPNSTKKWIKSIFDAKNIRAVVDKCSNVKMIILYNVPYITLRAVKKEFRGTGIKIVYDCTEWNSYAEGSFIKRWYKKLDEFQIRHFLGSKTDGLILISSLMFNKYKKSNKNILILPPLVDLDDNIWNQQRIKHDNRFEFCFAGSIANKESLDQIVNAFDLLKEQKAYLRIVGLDKDMFVSSYPDCKAVIDRNDDRICFMGRLSHEETVKYVLSCNCYIFIRESTRRNNAGFPTKFVEAYSCGIPIITTDVSDVKKYSDKCDRVVLLENTSVNGILVAMNNILNKHIFDKDNKELDKTFDYRNYVEESRNWSSFV